MIHIITARNVNRALSDGLWWLKVSGVLESSRNGSVLVAPGPVLTEYLKPCERVLFSAARDANPYFHLFEALWMLAGRNDLAWIEQFNSRFSQFSDDGKTLHAAYGYRWRNQASIGKDQIQSLIHLLRTQPGTRRAVLSMWEPAEDLHTQHKDIPCNTHIYFDRREKRLNMTVCCRSNDAIWGTYGANAVHFSVLQEYLAAYLGTPIGVYRQFSNNFHAYTEMKGYPSTDPVVIGEDDRYSEGTVKPFPLIYNPKCFDTELLRFMNDPLGDAAYEEPFFGQVASPMYASWSDRKGKRNNGELAAGQIGASDWKTVCCEWIERRERKKAENGIVSYANQKS